jgi:hypothetical protein
LEKLLKEADDPFEVEERLSELSHELLAEHPDHETTVAVVEGLETGTMPYGRDIGGLIIHAGQLLEAADQQLRRIPEKMDGLKEASIVLITSRD